MCRDGVRYSGGARPSHARRVWLAAADWAQMVARVAVALYNQFGLSGALNDMRRQAELSEYIRLTFLP